jgi:hypothetical protein
MPRGYDPALYMLPFDQQGSFQLHMFGCKPPLSDVQTAEMCSAAARTTGREWLGIVISVPGFIGSAVGRTAFWDPLIAGRAKTSTREQVVAEFARHYREFVDVFEKAQNRLSSGPSERARSEYGQEV